MSLVFVLPGFYHLPCGIDNGSYQCDDDKKSFCHRHWPKKTSRSPKQRRRRSSQQRRRSSADEVVAAAKKPSTKSRLKQVSFIEKMTPQNPSLLKFSPTAGSQAILKPISKLQLSYTEWRLGILKCLDIVEFRPLRRGCQSREVPPPVELFWLDLFTS